MANLRDHQPVVLDKFNGLWARDDYDNTPIDHFQDCDNIDYLGTSSFAVRAGLAVSQNVNVPLANVRRIYNYATQTANTTIVLTYDPLTGVGSIHHVVNSTTTYGPILAVLGMTDFAFVSYAGRGYISPFGTFAVGDLFQQKGLSGQFLYVYAGDGTQARKAAGVAITGALTIAFGAAGHTDAGTHVFGFVSETVSGYLSPPGALTSFVTVAANSVSFGTIPTSGDPNVTKRYLVATKAITGYTGNTQGYQFFFVPGGTISNNTAIFLNDISFFDQDLIDDASYLFDNYAEIPAGASLTLYHDRLCLSATYADISLTLVSAAGEPEAINQIDGLIVTPLDGNPITNSQELRDVLYIFKRSRTVSYTDNGDVPSTWPLVVIDTALGTSVHGIGTVLDSGGASVDFLIVCTYQGISLFNGRYIAPELSFKIDKFWRDLDRSLFNLIQVINAPIQKEIMIVLPDRRVLVGNYSNGFDPMKIRWSPWTFLQGINTICIVNIDEIVLGADIP